MMRAGFFFFLLITAYTSKNHTVELQLHGLPEPLEVLRDEHDISHIYVKSGDIRSPFYKTCLSCGLTMCMAHCIFQKEKLNDWSQREFC